MSSYFIIRHVFHSSRTRNMYTITLKLYFFLILHICLCSQSLHVVLWLSNYDTWERDFLHDMFPSDRYFHITASHFNAKFNQTTVNDTIYRPRVMVYNIENSGDDGRYQVVRDYIGRFKPLVLVHLSDEFQGWSKKWKYGEGVEVFNLVPLVLREYSIKPYISKEDPRSNVIQIPLGYMKNMFNDSGIVTSSLDMIQYSNNKKSAERNISWSFIGGVSGHRDRKGALDTFQAWTPNVVTSGFSPQEMRHVYNDSLFVLVGRGLVNLDCLRIYEAMICGAIPIVVGGEGELAWVFQYEGHRPPLLYADSYQDALIACKSMNHSEIDSRRDALTHWYTHRMHHIMNKVSEVFQNDTSSRHAKLPVSIL